MYHMSMLSNLSWQNNNSWIVSVIKLAPNNLSYDADCSSLRCSHLVANSMWREYSINDQIWNNV